MLVRMFILFMLNMTVLMRPVPAGVLILMNIACAVMVMRVGMLMFVRMSMLMFVFVCFFHCALLLIVMNESLSRRNASSRRKQRVNALHHCASHDKKECHRQHYALNHGHISLEDSVSRQLA
jgi:hypothetical protein